MNLSNLNLSLTFGITFIILAFLGLIAFVVAIWKAADPTRLDKTLDVWKWTLGTLAIGVATSIISDSFKQREADRNEMAAFSQYVNIVVDSGTVAKKRRLCDFFIAVSPAGRMREAWQRYSDVLDNAKAKVDTFDKREKKIVSQIGSQKPTNAQIAALTVLQDQKQQVLNDVGATESGTYLIVAGGDKSLIAAKDQLKKAQKISSQVALFEKGNMYRTVFTGLTSKEAALQLLPQIQSTVNSGSYIVKQSNWCPVYHTTPDCVICNN